MRNRHFFVLDLLLLPLAVYFSYVLRLERLPLQEFWPSFFLFLFTVYLLTPAVFWRSHIYRRYWIYASVEELLVLTGNLTLVAVLAGLINLLTVWFGPESFFFPRAVPFIFLLLGLLATAGPRLLVRIATLWQNPHTRHQALKPTLIIGAGDAGYRVAREIQQNPHLGLDLVGFIDDAPEKQMVQIQGILVLGGRADIPQLVERYGIQQVIIAMPSAPGSVIREVIGLCEQAGIKPQTVPAIHELITGRVNIAQLRDVNIEDLLRRTPIQTDITAVSNMIYNQKVLVTGAGGSIGSELCRQLLSFRPAALILVGHGENSIFTIYHELLPFAGSTELIPLIADVRFPQRLQVIFETYRPDMVYHAAAHKHVPLMEHNPCEAITNNVIGTRNVLQAAQAVQVKRFVMISTDKAVNPTSIMGASKRTAEFLVHQAAAQSGRAYVAVRFGNVLGSRGSVVLTFKQQIAQGGPVTVTHPDITRFFMTIPEAVQLVLQASVIGQGGEVFVLDMGEPIKIVDLAKDLIELSGLKVGQDIEIQFTGLRPGEKLYEELFIPGENYHRTQHEKIFIAENASHFVPENINEKIQTLWQIAEIGDRPALIHQLQQLIPELKITTL